MTLGSFNVNNLSAFASIELNLDVKETSFVREAEKTLEKIIDEDCIMITEEMFNYRFNAFNKIVHKSAYEIFRFLFFLSTKHHAD
jgi:cardiolipin synthase